MKKEKTIQNRVRKFLEKDGWWVWKLPPFIKGIPDTINLKNGKVFFIEFKRNKGSLGIYQTKVILQLRNMGFNVWVIDDWEKFKEEYNGFARTL